MAFYVYILRCADGSYYTGHTDNLETCLEAPSRGEIRDHTFFRRPVTLVFPDQLAAREEAFERERQRKGWSRARKEVLIARDWEKLVRLSQNNYQTPDGSGDPSTSSG